ncbi:lysosomal membrane ascorbate-dependent ferrireductase CYB561A3-like isoform X1 [Centruroides vittatus]|uniref:lysosomal membrane ascorbate-dependent ferrireductase CYB561A3-like isoform X1 n=1 Tax=Centruroides vittatus TaxID=120091 RepID=UPI00350EDACA
MRMANDRQSFVISIGIVHLLSLTSLILVGIWTGKQLGGFSWQSNPATEFNYHPLFMVIFVYLYGNGMLIYRLIKRYSNIKKKIIHAVHFMLCFIFVVIALKAVFDSHDLAKIPKKNMYTLHSWIGLGAVILFSAQLVFGITMTVLKYYAIYEMKSFRSVHKYFGLTIFALIVGSCVIGINEKIIFKLKNKTNPTERYDHLPSLALTGNFLGVVLVIQAMYVSYLVTNSNYRKSESSDQSYIL